MNIYGTTTWELNIIRPWNVSKRLQRNGSIFWDNNLNHGDVLLKNNGFHEWYHILGQIASGSFQLGLGSSPGFPKSKDKRDSVYIVLLTLTRSIYHELCSFLENLRKNIFCLNKYFIIKKQKLSPGKFWAEGKVVFPQV